MTQSDPIAELLQRAKAIAVVGLSSNPLRPSHGVSAYMQSHGYRIIPVRPGLDSVLGERAYPSLREVPMPVDLVDVFRNSEAAGAVADEAIAAKAKTVWMQLGVINEEAAAKAEAAGLEVVMDRCPHIEIPRLRVPKVSAEA